MEDNYEVVKVDTSNLRKLLEEKYQSNTDVVEKNPEKRRGCSCPSRHTHNDDYDILTAGMVGYGLGLLF